MKRQNQQGGGGGIVTSISPRMIEIQLGEGYLTSRKMHNEFRALQREYVVIRLIWNISSALWLE